VTKRAFYAVAALSCAAAGSLAALEAWRSGGLWPIVKAGVFVALALLFRRKALGRGDRG